MSYARTLQRRLDIDLINQIEASGRRIKAAGSAIKSPRRQPRAAETYRGARRNRVMGRT